MCGSSTDNSLLGQGKQISYMRQFSNYYFFYDGNSNQPKNPLLRQAEELERLRSVQTKIAPVYVPHVQPVPANPSSLKKPAYVWTRTAQPEPIRTNQVLPVKTANNSSPPRPSGRKSHYKKPLPDQQAEHTAQKVYAAIWENSSDAKGHISKPSARRLVTTYGTSLIEQGLAVIARRKNISNPAGFLITWLRSESRRAGMMSLSHE